MKILAPLLLAAGLFPISVVAADEALDKEVNALLKSRNCLACHARDRRIVGPGFKEIALKYAGQKDSQARLGEKILKGGKGVWGEMPMPPNPTVKADEAGRLANWIINLK